MNKSIEQFTEVELKALAYDHLAAIERSQMTIKMINEELAKRAQVVPQKATEEPKKK